MQETISLIFSYAHGMWRYRWVGFLATVFACVIAWAVALLIPNEYEAHSRIQIDTTSVLKPLLQGLAAESGTMERVRMITRVLMSRPNLEKVARKADLDHSVSNDLEMEELLVEMRERIKIGQPPSWERRRDEQSIIFIDISFTDKEPIIAHNVVELLVDTLVETTLGENRTEASDAQSFLLAQIEQYEIQLKQAEKRLADFKKANVGMLPGQGSDYFSRMQSANEELEELREAHEIALSRYAVLKKQLKGEAAVLGTDPRIIAIDNQIARHHESLNDLLLMFTEEHPDVMGLRRTIGQLEQQKKDAVKEIEALGTAAAAIDKESLEINPVYSEVKIALSQAEVETRTIQAQIAKQEKRVEELGKLINTIPEVEAQLADLNRDYDVIRQQYLALLERLESASISEDIRSSNFDIKFQVVEPAIVPIKPVAPNRILFLAGATGVGIGVGLGVMFLLNMLFPVYTTVRDLRSETGYPVLGSVTMVFSNSQIRKRHIGYWMYGCLFICLLVFAAGLIIFNEAATYHAQNALLRIKM